MSDHKQARIVEALERSHGFAVFRATSNGSICQLMYLGGILIEGARDELLWVVVDEIRSNYP